MPGALPAVTVPMVASPRSPDAWLGQVEGRLQAGERLERGVAPGPSSTVTTVSRPLASRTVTGAVSASNRPASMAATAFWWLASAKASWSSRLTRVLDRDALGVRAHVAVLDGAPQAVVDGRVDQLAVAEAEAEARAGHEVGRLVHGFHAACDDGLRVAGPDLGGREHDRLEAGAADPVDGRGARAVRESRLQERLARGGLPDAGLQDLAHEHLVDPGRRRIEAGPLDGRPDRDAPELGGRDGAQRPGELADRRARGAHDEDVAVRSGVGEGHARIYTALRFEQTLAGSAPASDPLRSSSATIRRWIWFVPS